jgi:SAM-dependent methyltransferase
MPANLEMPDGTPAAELPEAMRGGEMAEGQRALQLRMSGATRQALRCPVCRSILIDGDETLVCAGARCGSVFPVVNGIPILINEAGSLFSRDEFVAAGATLVRFVRDEGGAGRAAGPGRRLKWLLDERLPTLDANVTSRRNFARFARLLLQQNPHPRVLVVGGQILGQGMERIIRHPAIEFVSLDVSLGARTTLVADAHDIPFAPGTFDGLIIQGVLHYLADPYHCVEEMHRVLKDDGLLYAETAFMQQVSYANDYTRFTHVGQRRLFRRFAEVDSGVACGPGMALAWAAQYFLLSFVRSLPARQAVIALSRLLLFWLKYFDYYLAPKPGAFDAASGYYFLGRKSHRALSEREIIGVYRGSQ